jgi:NAD(P)-dependent dehydrogenase (short-subunit alcohol dehydrogenase family)
LSWNGLRIALKLADQGANVAVHYDQNEAAALDSFAQVRDRGADGCRGPSGRVASQTGHSDGSAKVKAEFGKVDIFVSNAQPKAGAFF